METTAAIFRSQADTDRALAELKSIGLGYDKITVLRPASAGAPPERLVRTSDTESPGMGEAIGGTVGGAVGAAAGASLGAAVASLLLPGVGPIIIAGLLGAALLGTGAAIAGVQAGHLLEDGLANGLPHDELFVYEEALRNGHGVVIVYADDDATAEKARKAFARAGAESIDAARDRWWLGLRESERQEYERAGGNFDPVEGAYRRGFETALHPRRRGQSIDDAAADLDSESVASPAFRAGYERGQQYQQDLEERHGA